MAAANNKRTCPSKSAYLLYDSLWLYVNDNVNENENYLPDGNSRLIIHNSQLTTLLMHSRKESTQ